ncbi:hypothetical protein [Sorangium sp. So ce1389]
MMIASRLCLDGSAGEAGRAGRQDTGAERDDDPDMKWFQVT